MSIKEPSLISFCPFYFMVVVLLNEVVRQDLTACHRGY